MSAVIGQDVLEIGAAVHDPVQVEPRRALEEIDQVIEPEDRLPGEPVAVIDQLMAADPISPDGFHLRALAGDEEGRGEDA